MTQHNLHSQIPCMPLFGFIFRDNFLEASIRFCVVGDKLIDEF